MVLKRHDTSMVLPSRSSRLVVVARAGVLLAVLASAEVIVYVWRALDFEFRTTSGRTMSLVERMVSDGPSLNAAVVALAAVVMLLSLPAAGWSARSRWLIAVFVGLACIANLALLGGYLWLLRVDEHQRVGLVPEHLGGTFINDFPSWALSLVLLLIVADAMRPRPFRTAGTAAEVSTVEREEVDLH